MPATNFSDPKVINFLLENYEKESRIRMKWVQRHDGNFKKAATLTREEKNYTPEGITQSVIEGGMAATTRDHIAAARFRSTKPVPDYVFAKTKIKEPKQLELSMKPPPSAVKDTLKESRVKYLIKRNVLKPEEKFNFILSSNWQYGWKLGESELKMSGPEHGKVHHLLHNLRSRVGPQRDPDHYKSADTGHTAIVTL